MHTANLPYTLPLIAGAAISVALAVLSWRTRSDFFAMPFLILMLGIVVWSAGDALELSASSLSAKLLWARVQYFGIALVPATWLVIALRYAGLGRWVTRRVLALLAIAPLAVLALVWTNASHRLIWTSTRIVEPGGLRLLETDYGAVFWAYVAYAYLLIAAGAFLIAGALRRSRRLYRWQAAVILGAVAAAWLANVATLAGVAPGGMDVTPLGFAVAGIAIYLGRARFQLLTLLPVARHGVIDAMTDGVVVVDRNGRIADINRAAQEIAGLSSPDVIGQPLAALAVAGTSLDELIRRDAGGPVEAQVGDERETRWYDLVVSPVPDDRAAPGGELIVFQDVTHRKRVENELRLQKAILESQSEASLDGMVILSREGRWMSSNRRFLQEWGLPPHLADRCPSEPTLQLMASRAADPERFLARAQSLAADEDATASHEIALKDGRVLDSYTAPIKTDDGAYHGRVWFFRDVTETRKAEENLRQLARISLLNQITRCITGLRDEKEILDALLERLETSLPAQYACVLASDSNGDRACVAAIGPLSKAIATEAGLREGLPLPVRGTVLERCLRGATLYLPDTAESRSCVGQAMANNGIRSLMCTPLVADSKTVGILVTGRRAAAAFSSADGELLHTLGDHVALAVRQARLHSELEAAYQELRDTQRAAMEQERLRALGQMASGVAHDVNNALTPILAYAELLMVGEKTISQRGRRLLGSIKTSGEDIAQIIARMREFYRRREDADVLVPLDLSSLVQEAIDLTRPRWRDIPQRRGVVVDVHKDVEPGLPLVTGIPSEIREAMTNLIYNAVDAMPRGGIITIRARMAGTAAGADAARVALEVTDTGIGMDEETRRRCLEPFFTTKGEKGSGLGLAMVYGVMHRADGELKIESRVGVGTRVQMLFPPREPRPVAARGAVESAPRLPPMKFLCIDDDPVVREVIAEMLNAEGHTGVPADGGRAGIAAFLSAKVRDDPFDAVITDLGMPVVDGRKVARAVKRESPHTPVIMLTGWGVRIPEEEHLRDQVDYLLGKPPKPEELRQVLTEVAAQLEAPGPAARRR